MAGTNNWNVFLNTKGLTGGVYSNLNPVVKDELLKEFNKTKTNGLTNSDILKVDKSDVIGGDGRPLSSYPSVNTSTNTNAPTVGLTGGASNFGVDNGNKDVSGLRGTQFEGINTGGMDQNAIDYLSVAGADTSKGLTGTNRYFGKNKAGEFALFDQDSLADAEAGSITAAQVDGTTAFGGFADADKDKFLGLGNEGWGNAFKGGGLIMQGIGLRDTLKTNKLAREGMQFDLANARAEAKQLDAYRKSFA